jgi:hypothetical protein
MGDIGIPPEYQYQLRKGRGQMLWNLIQQVQLGEARDQASSLEQRVAYLEGQVERSNKVLVEVIKYLERKENRDVDGDGKIG